MEGDYRARMSLALRAVWREEKMGKAEGKTNKIVAKTISEDCIYHSISYLAGDDCGPFAGKQLTEGHPVTVQGTNAVRFKQKHKGQPIYIKYENRPELAKLVAEYKEIDAQKQAEREIVWAKKRAEEEAAAKPLIEAMNAKAEELRRSIPADHIEVQAEQIGSFDGYPQMEYTVDGFEIGWEDVNVVGWATATWPNALSPFQSICIASISREKLEELKAAKVAAEKKKAEDKRKAEDEILAKFTEAKETGKPVLLHKWMEDCCDPKEECSLDVHYEYAMPDGTTKHDWNHTW
jgi:hypothetical protein